MKIILKKIVVYLLIATITFTSVSANYTERVEASSAVAVVTTWGLAKVLTALAVGGVVAGGMYLASNTTTEDLQSFGSKIKSGFQQFVTEYEKNLIIQSNSQITEQEALQQAEATAIETTSNFWDNAVDTTKTTVNGVKTKTLDYWSRYCSGINETALISDSSGNLSGGDPLRTTKIDVNLPDAQCTYTANTHTVTVNGKNYLSYGGQFYKAQSNSFYTVDKSFCDQYGGVIPFILAVQCSNEHNYRYYTTIATMVVGLKINKIGTTISTSADAFTTINQNNIFGWDDNWQSQFQTAMSKSTYPLIMVNGHGKSTGQWYNGVTTAQWQNILDNYETYLNPVGGTVISNPWQRTVKEALDDTNIGQEIQTGRRVITNNGTDDIQGIFENDYPVIRSSLKAGANEGTYTGELGWDIPYPDVWDKYWDRDIDFPDVIGKTGALGIPKDDVIDNSDSDTVIEFPDDTVVNDPADNPDNPDTQDKPIKDIIEEQGGLFSPTAMDLTNFFPFCIPFDIYYLFNSLVATPETPTFDIEFAYPQKLKPYLGDSFVYTVDFSDFEVVARVLKIMLSLLFIFGLMRITRSIIRG